MGRERKITGALGERAAARFLKRNGYNIMGANVRTPFGEIDLVAKDRDVIVFVEVKTRRSFSLGPPCISVTKIKEGRMIRNAFFYLKRRGLSDADWRIDVASVMLRSDGSIENIELIRNAVQQDGW